MVTKIIIREEGWKEKCRLEQKHISFTMVKARCSAKLFFTNLSNGQVQQRTSFLSEVMLVLKKIKFHIKKFASNIKQGKKL